MALQQWLGQQVGWNCVRKLRRRRDVLEQNVDDVGRKG